MLDTHSDLAGLVQLARVDSDAEVRALWRRGMATLAALAAEHHPVPLEGFNGAALLASARIALSRGYVDDLGWLSPAAAAVAMFELAAALPRSDEKRELGRRVLQTLHQSDAETFISLAAALALGSSRVLRGAHARARVCLSLDLPVGLGIRADPLALALISRRSSEQVWLSEPSTGSLPSRRLAARLLERAAREAGRRYASGDDTGIRVFETVAVRRALGRLLADRESLVWRHAAAARGLLSHALSQWAEDIEIGLAADLTPTEWRRAAASLAARVALDPDGTLARCRRLLAGELPRADRGLAAALVHGLSCAADADPTAADALLDLVTAEPDVQVAEALADLRRERIGGQVGARAAERVRRSLARAQTGGDDLGHGALRQALIEELAPPEQRPAGRLHDHLVAALKVFAAGGDAAPDTERAVDAAHEALARLERSERRGQQHELDPATEAATYQEALGALRALDRGLLETSTLSDLLVLYAAGSRPRAERLVDRLARWLLARETAILEADELPRIHRNLIWRMRRLRALLHLVDADHLGDAGDERSEWRLRAVNVLLARTCNDASSPLRRAVSATLARACDAVVREELCELSDVLVATTLTLSSDVDLEVLAEASMDPTFKQAMRAYVDGLRQVAIAREQAADREDEGEEPALDPCLRALRAVIAAVPASESPRVEALRGALLQIARALEALAVAPALSATLGEGPSAPLSELMTGATRLARLIIGACRHLGYATNSTNSRLGSTLRALEGEIEHAVRGDRRGLNSALADAARTMRRELAPLIADVAALVLARLARLPGRATAATRVRTEPPAPVPIAPWLPPDRILGGFYILRTIDRGAVGSVFVACRVSERHDEQPPLFALKVPEYGGDAAHTLSEAEFMRMFRDEAQALLALPAHPNLARFITFDAGAKPKPILVMELVEGPTLERLLVREEMSVAEMLAVLDGVAAGLAAMHRVGVAHLDVKPANIILRSRAPSGWQSEEPTAEDPGTSPVLVDFGLAGRRIRPGCATVYYGAPEVWTEAPSPERTPMPTDVYAFACMAFEMLTGELLFDGDTAVAIVSEHLEHDGAPKRLREFQRKPHLAGLMSLFSLALRASPDERADIEAVRRGLAELAPALAGLPWPLV
ncbi:protein kinase domain-containing protein [Haliangium sp.]|uniref:protein kinase domain-containing protein n=1 Tax=Haliangium sp. TaxID=2663208 RepID=UPI003D0C6A9F